MKNSAQAAVDRQNDITDRRRKPMTDGAKRGYGRLKPAAQEETT